MGYSERSLRLFFKEVFGKTIIDIIQEKKFVHARHLFIMRFKLFDVANSIGIDDPSQFTRVFKKHFGISPKKYQAIYFPNDKIKKTKLLLKNI